MARRCNKYYAAGIVLLLVWLVIVIGLIAQSEMSKPSPPPPVVDDDHDHQPPTIFDTVSIKEQIRTDVQVVPTDPLCTYWNCINSSKCVDRGHGLLTLYVYDVMQYVDEDSKMLSPPLSKEFTQLLWALAHSKYAVKNPADACIFIPPIDTLNTRSVDSEAVSRVLASLPMWCGGANHLLFNMWPSETDGDGSLLDIQTGKAMLAATGFTHHSYRNTFDVAIPFFNPHQVDSDFVRQPGAERDVYLVSAQLQMYTETFDLLKDAFDGRSDLLLLTNCNDAASRADRCSASGQRYSYPRVLTRARYCLMTRAFQVSPVGLHDMLRAGCVPVVAVTSLVMPFYKVLDWKRAAVFINDHQLPALLDILKGIDADRNTYDNLAAQGKFYYENYMQSIERIALTTMDVLNERVLPHTAKSYNEWNRPIIPDMPRNPFFVPLTPSMKQGFTAVVLTYERIELMKQVVANVGQAKHLAKVLVIWNNPDLPIPKDLQWPAIKAPIKVIQSKHNRLSNRFYPYTEIETDCVLTIDDDIVMVPADELDFAYRVWVENPDRLVGFPPRYHTSNGTHWRYESEWMSNISMVLTGVAFYHKYYHYLYTSSLPGDLKQWVDNNMNCEDVAMNYLIANVTGKAPMKVLARKKFKVTSGGISEGIRSHLVARSTCMKVFTQTFGVMPLRTVEFRADPVLYKVPGVDESMQWYFNDGSL